MHSPPFTHLLVEDIQLIFTFFFVVRNKGAINFLFFYPSPWVKVATQINTWIWNCWAQAVWTGSFTGDGQFFKAVAPIYTSIASMLGFLSNTLVMPNFKTFAKLVGVKWFSSVWICNSLFTSETERTVICLLATCLLSFFKLPPWFVWRCFYWILSYHESEFFMYYGY